MMSKAILIMDMPRYCCECPVGEVWEVIPSVEECYCGLENKNIINKYHKPEWCPLKSPPKRFIRFGEEDDYAEGYNDCLNEILGE